MVKISHYQTFFTPSLLALALLVGCSDARDDVDKKVDQTIQKNNDIFINGKKKAQYERQADLDEIDEKCTGGDCDRQELKKWIEVLPAQDYFEQVKKAEAETRQDFQTSMAALVKDVKEKASEILTQLNTTAEESIIAPIRANAAFAGVKIMRVLQEMRRTNTWDKEITGALYSKTLAFLCSDMEDTLSITVKLKLLQHPDFTKLMPLKIDVAKYDAEFKAYKQRSKDLYESEFECAWWKKLIPNRCSEEYLKVIKSEWNESGRMSRNVNGEIKKAYCSAAKP